MAVVRVSVLNVPADQLDRVEAMMREAEAPLQGIRQLPGLLAYFAGVDREKGQLSNVSVWESEAHAKQMASFQPMLDLAQKFLAVPGLSFVRPIPNFTSLWEWGSASGGSAR
jgi:quinol monooxygenase YgiN